MDGPFGYHNDHRHVPGSGNSGGRAVCLGSIGQDTDHGCRCNDPALFKLVDV
jgi:hypothetical protein